MEVRFVSVNWEFVTEMLTENIFEGAVVTRDFENNLAGFWKDFVEARLLIIFSFVVPTTVINMRRGFVKQ